jgi:hypothetical protein
MFVCLHLLQKALFQTDSFNSDILQGGSNMTETNCDLFTHKSVPVIFEPPCFVSVALSSLLTSKTLQVAVFHKHEYRFKS